MDLATSVGVSPTPGGTAQSELQPPRHQRPSLTSFTRISTASACILSPFKGSACKQSEQTKKPKPSAINDGESRIKKHSLLLLRSELRLPVFTTSIQHSTGSPSQRNQARKKIKGIHWKEKSNLCSEIT